MAVYTMGSKSLLPGQACLTEVEPDQSANLCFQFSEKKREFSPKFLMILSASAFCQQLLPCLAGNLNLARVCRNLNSWGCTVGCAIPDGMLTHVHMSVWDAQQCLRLQKCKRE